MKPSKRFLALGSAVLLISLFGAALVYRVAHPLDPNAPPADARASGDSTATSGSGSFDTDLPIPVEAGSVVRAALILSVSAAGEAGSFRATQLRAQVGGQVKAVRVRENAGVGAGAVLVEIDPVEYQLNLQEAKSSLARTEASYREQLVFDERITDAAVRAEREKNARARTGLDGAEAAARKAQLNLERTSVRAPFAGRIANLRVVPGQYVNAGEELLTVQQMDPLRVDVQVLESEVGFIAPGHGARLSFAAFPGETYTGQVESINPIVDQKTRTARVTVSVRNPQQRLLPGMYARVALSAQRLPGRVLIPTSALLEREHRNLVFVFDGEGAEGLAKWRYVWPGLRNDSLVEIVSNPEFPDEIVRPGERVLTEGHYSLIHDARVRVTSNARGQGGRPQ